MLALVIYLAICGANTTSAADTAPVDIRLAPSLPAWPLNLPDSAEAPADGRFIYSGGNIGASGTFLPHELSLFVLNRLQILDDYPDRCQARLDALIDVHRVELANTIDVARADAKTREVMILADKTNRWPMWATVTAVIGAVAVGVSTGYLIGHFSK